MMKSLPNYIAIVLVIIMNDFGAITPYVCTCTRTLIIMDWWKREGGGGSKQHVFPPRVSKGAS